MKPILFNSEMVRDTLDNRRTVIRLLIKPQPTGKVNHFTGYKTDFWGEDKVDSRGTYVEILKPPYKAGDILYVRETWAKDPFGTGYIYPTEIPGAGQKWKPSIHMPKAAARIFLEVKTVQAQRLQDFLCCRSEIAKEGIPCEGGKGFETAKKRFKALWDGALKPEDRLKYSFDANPWVWAIEFEKIDRPESFDC